ncbi:hypothetical protein PW035_59785, partial [Nonomuraea angiospora]|nr:hypothetical protein [Nonomuraea angiospora]
RVPGVARTPVSDLACPRVVGNPGVADGHVAPPPVQLGRRIANDRSRRCLQPAVPAPQLETPLPPHRRVLRVLAELPGRAVSREPGWETYLVRLALAYHDAHEHAPAVPVGDQAPGPVHTARVRLAGAVAGVLPGPERM